MQRLTMTPRDNWERTIESQGLLYSASQKPDGTQTHYWNESAAYVLKMWEVLELEKVTERHHRRAIEAAKFLAEEQRNPASPWAQLGLPREAVEHAIYSLERGDPTLYGRFDYAYDGIDGSLPIPKMLEYNADTPTGLVEAAVVQWFWLQDVFPAADQWNGIYEALIDRFAELSPLLPGVGDSTPFYFAYTGKEEYGEDIMNVSLLRETAEKAGLQTRLIEMTQIGFDHGSEYHRPHFVDFLGEEIERIFKLYPHEDLAHEDFGPYLAQTAPQGWVEPAWKMFLSTKMLPAAMWHLYPTDEALLPTYIDKPSSMDEYVKKPLHGREGDNIEIVSKNYSTKQSGRYGEEGYVYQQWCPLPNFRGEDGSDNHAVLGSWVIGDESYGVGIRESDSYITDYYCRFVPNVIL